MKREEFTEAVSKKLKLIRTEQGYSQEQMAAILSVSNKTLVEVEKGRKDLSFCNAIAVAVIFEDSEVIEMILGGDVKDSIKSLALDHYENLHQTRGGKVWWKDVESTGDFKIQQNIISQHYRIISKDDLRLCSSFDRKYIDDQLKVMLFGQKNSED